MAAERDTASVVVGERNILREAEVSWAEEGDRSDPGKINRQVPGINQIVAKPINRTTWRHADPVPVTAGQ
jgi:hypothetical protein